MLVDDYAEDSSVKVKQIFCSKFQRVKLVLIEFMGYLAETTASQLLIDWGYSGMALPRPVSSVEYVFVPVFSEFKSSDSASSQPILTHPYAPPVLHALAFVRPMGIPSPVAISKRADAPYWQLLHKY